LVFKRIIFQVLLIQLLIMKKIYLFLALLLTVNITFAQLLTEDFNYAAGQLLTNNGWTAHSGAGTNPITVTAPGLTYAGHPGSGIGNAVTMTTSGEDDNKTFTAINSGDAYFSFLVNVSAATATGDYFIGLLQSTTIFPYRVYAKSDGAGGFFFGISKANGAIVYDVTSRSFGTTYFIVGKYTYNTATTTDDVLNLWVNPALGGSETAATIANVTGVSTDATTIIAAYLRQGTASSASTQQVDAILVGTTWAQVTPSSGSVATLSASALTGFGNVCINTTAGPNSFTITGTSLSSAPVTVGALAGFTYATSAGGPYTTSLSLTQPGGSYSKQVYVSFNPTLVQSYNGSIPVGGGGATGISVAATGSGINPLPAVTTGAASAITINSATLAGSATTACGTIISPYGIEYSTTNGFPNGSGTQANASNLSGANFSSNVAGLSPGTTYYYHAYATNAAGIAYGAQQSFTTLNPALTATALTGFGNVCINTTVGPISFTINGTNLSAVNITVGALSGYTYSTTAGGSYTTTLNLTQPGGTYSQPIFVNFNPTLVQSYNGSIPVSGGGAAAITVSATGAGVNSVPTLTTGAASAITTNSATCAGTINSNGCTAVTVYGIEYSTTVGFPNGTGTAVTSSNLSGGNFTSALIGLLPNTTYYYHAYATNAGGTGYGLEANFTTQALTPTLSIAGSVAFGNICLNTLAGPQSFTINGSALTAANINVAALAGFTYSTTAGGTYTTTLSLTQPGGTYSQQVFVKFLPTIVQSYNGNIVVSGGGAPANVNASATGAGVNTAPSLTTGGASAITSITATCAGTNVVANCSAISGYGIEYSTTNGFPNGTGTQVASGNLAGGNFTANLTGLTPTTTYYYHAYATNAGGTTYGAQQSFTTATPVLTAGALTAFGNVCTNTTAGPNSFTITGTNLTTANVTVGALAGFTFSTTLGGTYSTTLSLTQASGAYAQTIYVKFSPVAVQSYNGNIVLGGGGAASINVAASGAGINTAATVTSGAASAITQTTATVAGTIPAIGCTAVTAYGIEYSTTNGFPNGGGIAVASSNLSGINFSSNLSGLLPSTTYYYHAYATNGGGTTYGTQGSFTTSAPVLTAGTLTAFGAVCLNATAGPNSFIISSNALLAGNINVGPLNGFSFATTSAGTYSSSLSLTQPGGGAAYLQTVYVKFTPTAVQSYNGNIPVSGGGAPISIVVFASGSGINTIASVTTGTASVITPNAATLNGSVTSIGCSAVTAYGIEYSGISGLANGLGTKVPSANINAGSFSSNLTGLVQGSTYYYKAYAVNNGGIAYGAEQSFTTLNIPGGYVIYSVPISRGGNIHFTLSDVKAGHYAAQIFNIGGQLVFQKDFIIQVSFMDETFSIPYTLTPGVYNMVIADPEFRVKKTFMIQ
jgi:phosphodiesterase/alkaline phosphatase D-like protein